MLAEIALALSETKTASELLSGLLKVIKGREGREEILKIQGIITDTQAKIVDVNAKYAELLESKDAVAAKLKQHENWDAERANYEIWEITPGSFVLLYCPRPTVEPRQRDHYACPYCFEEHKNRYFNAWTSKPVFTNAPSATLKPR